MLSITDAGVVRHTGPCVHHAVPRPRRSEALEALAQLSEHLESLAVSDIEAARQLRKARDTLAIVVATAY